MKRFICLCAALLMLMASALADTNEQLLWAIEAAQEHELFAEAIDDSDSGYRKVLSEMKVGDRTTPTEVYRFVPDLDMHMIVRYSGYGVTKEQLPYLKELVMADYINFNYNKFSEEQLIVLTLATSKTVIGESGYEFWLLCYEQGGNVLVTFCPYDTGTVMVSARYWPVSKDVEEVLTMLEETYGYVQSERVR